MTTTPLDDNGMDVPETAQEFAYIDTRRTRTLLGNLFDGLPDAVQRVQNSGKFKAGLKWAVTAEYESRSGQLSESASRDLDSLHFKVLELALEAEGFLRDITEDVGDPKVWNGPIKHIAPAKKIIRVTAPTTMVNYLRLVQGFQKLWPHFDPSLPRAKKGPKPLTLADKIKSGDRAAVLSALEEMSPAGTIIRIEPFGDRHPNRGFVGTLNTDHFYDDEASFALRHGYRPQEWTTVALVNQHAEGVIPDSDPIATAAVNLQVTGKQVDRGAFSQVVRGIGNYLWDSGMTEAPTAPGVSITPIAVYQNISKHEAGLGG